MSRRTLRRTMSRRTCAFFCLFLIWLAAGARARADSPRGETALPRYRFQVGQELVYSYRDDEVDENQLRSGGPVQKARSQCTGQWQIWVLGQNADGSVRLLVDRALREVAPDRHIEISRRLLADFDIFPEGRIVLKRAVSNTDTYHDGVNYPTPLFVTLPADKKALVEEWLSPTNAGSRSPDGRDPAPEEFRCSIDWHSKGSGTLTIRCRQQLRRDGFPGLTKSRVCSFDVAAGRLLGFDEESNADYGKVRWRNVAAVRLVSVSPKPAEWLAELKREADTFFQLRTQYEADADTFRQCQSIKECTDRLTKARNSLTSARDSSTLEPIREQYAALLKQHDANAKWSLQKAKGREELCAAPPADWELTDFDGKPHHLRDYRGRVVVLEFWCKGCGWCIIAMPQIKELALAYKSKGVAVLGMNVDEEDEDALSVIRRERFEYATLKARPAEKFYHTSDFGCPFFIVLDQTGRVRHVEIGYSPYLARRLGIVIDRLASAPPTTK
jgi:thiol-disulfide isomerase/thioredoxin